MEIGSDLVNGLVCLHARELRESVEHWESKIAAERLLSKVTDDGRGISIIAHCEPLPLAHSISQVGFVLFGIYSAALG
jgi:hypothetical protein